MNPRAFTLIELLIVISIIMIIATVGITSFSSARMGLVVDLESDKLVSLLHTLRNETRAKSKCFGIAFEKNKPPQKIEAAYKNPVEGCDKPVSSTLQFDPDLVLTDVKLDARAQNAMSVTFVPPYGTMQFEPHGNDLELALSLRTGAYVAQTIRISSTTGKIEKMRGRK